MNLPANTFLRLSNSKVYRVTGHHCFLSAYLVETSLGMVQVNSVPEFFKSYFRFLPVYPKVICITKPILISSGDSLTGIEFVLWSSFFSNAEKEKEKIKIIGRKKNLDKLKTRLEVSMKGNFISGKDGHPLSVKDTNSYWALEQFEWIYVENAITIGETVFSFPTDKNVMISEKQEQLFDLSQHANSLHEPPTSVSSPSPAPQITNPTNIDELCVTIVGNGIATMEGVTSSFLVEYKKNKILIDVPAYYRKKLENVNIDPDSITHIIISHVHEDHVEGFSALMYDKIAQRKKIDLVTTVGIYQELINMYSCLFEEDISHYINFYDIESPTSNNVFGELMFETRRNYHPVETLGFKFFSPNKRIGISGDTLYTASLLEALLRNNTVTEDEYHKLLPSWFEDVNDILHEVTIFNDKVHTKLKDLEDFAQALPKQNIYGYHYVGNLSSAFVKQSFIGMKI